MHSLLQKLQIEPLNPGACTGPDGWIAEPDGHKLTSFNPTTGEAIAAVTLCSPAALRPRGGGRHRGVPRLAGDCRRRSAASSSAISARRCAS